MQKSKLENPWVVALLAAVFFVPFLGNVHLFDWDEINFAESAREMLLTGNYLRVQIDFQPFWEKPPLFIWLQALSMKFWGVNEWAARFPNALVGIITLVIFFVLGKRLYDARFGFLWALAYLGSITPHLYFKSGIIDPTFNLFMFLSVVFLMPSVFFQKISLSHYALAGVFAGLAVWTKGPVGVGLPTLTLGLFWAMRRFRAVISGQGLVVYVVVAGLFTLGWMAAIILESGWTTFVAFLEYLYRLGATSEADHGQPFYYHFVVVLLGCFPISVLGLKYVSGLKWLNIKEISFSRVDKNIKVDTPQQAFALLMFCLFWVVMIVFSVVKTKIVHYSSMAYFPLAFLASLHLYRWLKGEVVWPKWATVMLIIIGSVLSLAFVALPLVGMYAPLVSPYIDDPFVVGNLQAPVEWKGWEWGLGILFLGATVFSVSIWQKHPWKAIQVLFFGTAIFLFFYMAKVIPNIEGYTQRTVIDFYQSKRGQEVYVWPIGNRSYAQYFYFNKPPGVRPEASDEAWLLNGPVDKPTFLVARIDRADEYRSNPNLELIKEENGFVFFRRKPDYQKISDSFLQTKTP
ncbi:MAG: ArnT family glycosyltransferase [Runella sp.]